LPATIKGEATNARTIQLTDSILFLNHEIDCVEEKILQTNKPEERKGSINIKPPVTLELAAQVVPRFEMMLRKLHPL
jgi:hypothetical protein